MANMMDMFLPVCKQHSPLLENTGIVFHAFGDNNIHQYFVLLDFYDC